MSEFRFDLSQLTTVRETPEGYLRGDAVVTRAGVFVYREPDGTIRRELRHPDDVFHPDSLATLPMLPITLNHPSFKVDATNVRDVQVGATGETISRDDDHIISRVSVMAADAIAAVKRGKQELSLGYTLELEDVQGEYEGQRYDARQRNIRYNHLAIVDQARAGKAARLNLDGAVMEIEEKPMADMVKLALDGIQYDASPEVVRHVAKLTERYDSALKDVEAATAKADAAEARADEAERRATEAEEATAQALRRAAAAETRADNVKTRADEDAAGFATRVRERVALETRAKLFATDSDFSKMSDRAIQELCVKTQNPDVKLSDRSDEYVAARFDALLEPKDPTKKLAPRLDARVDATQARRDAIASLSGQSAGA